MAQIRKMSQISKNSPKFKNVPNFKKCPKFQKCLHLKVNTITDGKNCVTTFLSRCNNKYLNLTLLQRFTELLQPIRIVTSFIRCNNIVTTIRCCNNIVA